MEEEFKKANDGIAYFLWYLEIVPLYKSILKEQKDSTPSSAAIQSLSKVVRGYKATTFMDISNLLRSLSETLTSTLEKENEGLQKLSVETGCEIFKRYVMIKANDIVHPDEAINVLKTRAKTLAEESRLSKSKICQYGQDFILNNSTILVHGYSRVVCALLLYASEKKRFHVLATEGRPGGHGVKILDELLTHNPNNKNITVDIILDCSVGYYMDKIDMVFFGATCVSESGGIINRIGSYQISIIAKALNKPVYVVTESSKFVTLFPLSQTDLPHGANKEYTFKPDKFVQDLNKRYNKEEKIVEEEKVVDQVCVLQDYTPPQYITLLLTDQGVFTPSAVSDELIKLFRLCQ